MKTNVISLFAVLIFTFFCSTVARGQNAPLVNRHQVLMNLLRTLSNRNLAVEFEFTQEQSRQIMNLERSLRNAQRHFEDRVDRRNPNQKVKEIYTKRFAEDMDLVQSQLKEDILLPHQIEVLGKVQKRLELDWHFQRDFQNTKGTSLENLELTEKQMENLRDIKQGYFEKYAEEQKRFAEAIRKLKEEAMEEIQGEMTEEQREMLNFKEPK